MKTVTPSAVDNRAKDPFRKFAELLPEIVFETDVEGNLTFINLNAFSVTGYTPEDIDGGLNVFELLVSEDRDRAGGDLHGVLAGQEGAGPYEYRILRKNGSTFPVIVHATPVIHEGAPVGMRGIIGDVTDRKRAEKEILEYKEQVRQLVSKLCRVEERQRRSIATVLHDSIGQHLAASSMNLQLLRECDLPDAHAEALDEALALIRQVSKDTRSLTLELCPPLLYEMGLAAAVEWLLGKFRFKYGIDYEFENHVQSVPLNDDLRGLLFQAVRELLLNIIKHADARHVKVAIASEEEDFLNIRVEDDGIGFDVSQLDCSRHETGGFGLFNLRERLRHLDGRIEIESHPGRGTAVTIGLPINAEKEAAMEKLREHTNTAGR